MRKIIIGIFVLALLFAAVLELTNPAEANAMHTIVNDTGYTVTRVYVKLSSDGNWGRNWLEGHGNLRSGNDLQVSLEPGTYDIMMVDTDEDSYVKWWQEVRDNSRTTFTLDDIAQG